MSLKEHFMPSHHDESKKYLVKGDAGEKPPSRGSPPQTKFLFQSNRCLSLGGEVFGGESVE